MKGVTIVLLLSFVLFVAVETVNANFVASPGFEDPSPWSAVDTGQLTDIAAGEGRAGSSFELRIQDGACCFGFYQDLATTEDTTYIISIYLRMPTNTAPDNEFNIDFGGIRALHVANTHTNDVYQLFAGASRATTTTTTLTLSGYDTVNYLFADDVSVEEAEACSPAVTHCEAASCNGENACVLCEMGYKLDGVGGCTACTSGTYSDRSEPADTCNTCPAAGQESAPASDDVSDCSCPAETTISLDGLTCEGDTDIHDDPVVIGFDGRVFDFKGVPNRVFNMLSVPDLQVSNYFIAANRPGDTFTGAVGVRQGGVSAIKFDLGQAYYYADNTTTPKHITFPMKAPMMIPNGGIITRPSFGELKVEWPLYSVLMKRMHERHPGQKVGFSYIDTSIVMKIAALAKDNVNGVLGQTYHHTNSSEFYSGTWEDYAAPANVNNVFTDAFPAKFFKYDPETQIVHTPGAAQHVGVHK